MRDTTPSTYAAPLPFLGVLRFQGRDAAAFLQGQVTHDTRLLADGRTLLAACNTPQGRVIALLRLRQAQAGAAVHALLPADLLEHVAARLRRFVLRAKVEVQIATDLQLVWVGGPPFSTTLAAESRAASGTSSAMPVADQAEVIAFDYDAHRRVVAASGPVLRAMTGLSLSQALPDIEQAWWAADIAAGLPQVLRAGSEQFVPQMLNLDLLDAISFTKGCYTGQEIVARTQHLGRIKRRTFRYRIAGGEPLAPLASLQLSGTKVAEVVMSASRGDVVELLAVTQLDARDRALVTEDGREALPVGMPYEV